MKTEPFCTTDEGTMECYNKIHECGFPDCPFKTALTTWEKQCMEFEDKEQAIKAISYECGLTSSGRKHFTNSSLLRLKPGTVIEGLDLPCVEVEQYWHEHTKTWRDIPKGTNGELAGKTPDQEYRIVLRFVDKAIKETEPEGSYAGEEMADVTPEEYFKSVNMKDSKQTEPEQSSDDAYEEMLKFEQMEKFGE